MAQQQTWHSSKTDSERAWWGVAETVDEPAGEEPLASVETPWYANDDGTIPGRPSRRAWRGIGEVTEAPEDVEAEPAFAATIAPGNAAGASYRQPTSSGGFAPWHIALLVGALVLGALFFVANNVAARQNTTTPPIKMESTGFGVTAPTSAPAITDQPAPTATSVQLEAPQGTSYITLKPVVLRDKPGVDGATVADWPVRTAAYATGIWARGADGIIWWEMVDAWGHRGWAPGMDLEPLP